MRVLLQKQLGALRPVDEAGAEVLKGIKNGEVVACEVKRPRNPRHHRLYWALITILFENQSRYGTVEELSDVVKCATGHCTVIDAGGKEIRIPKSISFAKMDQDEFRRFFDRVVDLAVTRIIPGLSRDDLRREVLEMIGEKEAA